MARYLHLHGALAGQTTDLKVGTVTYRFVEGRFELPSGQDNAGLAEYLRRVFNAREEVPHEADAEASELAEVREDEGGAGDPAGAGGPQSEATGGTPSGVAAEAEVVTAEAGLHARIGAAVAQLDPTNDDHWTADGRPSMRAVEGLLGRTDVTRRDVDAVVGAGFRRPAAS